MEIDRRKTRVVGPVRTRVPRDPRGVAVDSASDEIPCTATLERGVHHHRLHVRVRARFFEITSVVVVVVVFNLIFLLFNCVCIHFRDYRRPAERLAFRTASFRNLPAARNVSGVITYDGRQYGFPQHPDNSADDATPNDDAVRPYSREITFPIFRALSKLPANVLFSSRAVSSRH